MSKKRIITPYKFKPSVQKIALKVIAKTGNRQDACDAVRINISTFNRQLLKDPAFKDAFEQAQGRFHAHLEKLALNLAEGTDHIKVGRDGTQYTDKKYHPTVLLATLKANLPEKWGDKKTVDHTHTHNQKIDLGSLTQTERDQLQAMILNQLEPVKQLDVEVGPAKDLDTGTPDPVESKDDEGGQSLPPLP